MLLAGDGGDELFGGNDRYAKQLLFERFSRLATLLMPVASGIEQHWPSAVRPALLRKAASFLRQAATPLPERLQTYNFLHQIAPAEIFAAALLSEVDTHLPLAALRAAYLEPALADAINRMLYLDWKFTLADNDLVKVAGACRLAGVDVAFPMLSDEMVEFSSSLPTDWKTTRRELRVFYKQAMRGFLPDEIIAKTKHGFGLPFGVWTREHPQLRELAYDCVLSLRSRGWFNAHFLERVIELHRAGHAAYYGELVWILMTLELWLRRNVARP